MNRACEALSLLMCTLAFCVTATGSKTAEAAEPQSCQRCPAHVSTAPINQCNQDGSEYVDPSEEHSEVADCPASDGTDRYVDEDSFYDEDYDGGADQYGYEEADTANEAIQSHSDAAVIEVIEANEVIEDTDLRSEHDDVYDNAVYGEAESTSDETSEQNSAEGENRLDVDRPDYDSAHDDDYDYGYGDSNVGDNNAYDSDAYNHEPYDYDSIESEGSKDADDQPSVESDYDTYMEGAYEDFDYEGPWYDADQSDDIQQADDSDVVNAENATDESSPVDEYRSYDHDADDYDTYDYDQYWYDRVEDDGNHEAHVADRVADDADQRESIADQMLERLHTVTDLPRQAVDYVMQSKDRLSASLWYSHVIDRLQQAIDNAAAHQPSVAMPATERHALDADFGFADEASDENWDCFAPDFDSTGINHAPVVTAPAIVETNSDDQTASAALRYDRAVMLSIAKVLDHTGNSLRHISRQLTRVAQADVDLAGTAVGPQEGAEQR